MASLDLTRPQDLRLLKTLLSISSIAPRRSAQPAHLDSMATALSASAERMARAPSVAGRILCASARISLRGAA